MIRQQTNEGLTISSVAGQTMGLNRFGPVLDLFQQ
jgi:hypothetical protein